jgi:hypothetical protein
MLSVEMEGDRVTHVDRNVFRIVDEISSGCNLNGDRRLPTNEAVQSQQDDDNGNRLVRHHVRLGKTVTFLTF